MSKRRLLLLSNSKNYGQEYLEHAEAAIKSFTGDGVSTILFVPYAGVTIAWDTYASMVRRRFKSMGYAVQSIHEMKDARAAIEGAGAIAVGGGNTFQLIHHLHKHDLVSAIRERVEAGVPYMGWSAGSNVACPTIRTTNDMPIIEPQSFAALDLIPFQINTHYIDTQPSEHQGETREQRIEEFIEIKPDTHVVGLREGSILKVEGSTLELLGEKTMRVFKRGEEPRELTPAESLDFLLGTA